MDRLERDVWARVKRCVPADVWGKRLEDASGDLGTFDVVLMRKRRAMWIELKFGGPNAKPDMRKGQAAFAMKGRKYGVKCVVIMGHPDGSCRIIDGVTTGEDWRDHLLSRWDEITEERMKKLIDWGMCN